MKLLFYTALILTLISTTFCSKDDDDIENPEWVNEWIAEIESMDECFMCEIHRYEYQGQFYFEFYSPILSCRSCQVHHDSGEKVNWELMDHGDYLAKRKHKKVIYKKQPD